MPRRVLSGTGGLFSRPRRGLSGPRRGGLSGAFSRPRRFLGEAGFLVGEWWQTLQLTRLI